VDYYPIYLKLTGKPCVVVGGGNVATRKIATLIDAGASVSVVSLSISSEIAGWIELAQLHLTGKVNTRRLTSVASCLSSQQPLHPSSTNKYLMMPSKLAYLLMLLIPPNSVDLFCQAL